MSGLTVGKMLQRIVETKGMSGADALRHMAGALAPDDPERLYTEWLADNAKRLREAARELGLQVEEGPGFGRRLHDAWMARRQQA